MFRDKKTLLFFLMPGLIGIMLFWVLPFWGGILFSFTDGTVHQRFVWFENYKRIWQNAVFILGLRNTMELSLICAPIITIVSFGVSDLLWKLKEESSLIRSVLLLPYLIPSAALVMVWSLLFDYGGVANRLMQILGLPRVFWLEGPMMRLPIILLYIWKNIGFSIVIYSAAIQALPDEYYDVARIEGANATQQQFFVTLPLIKKTTLTIFILAWINALKIFKEVYFLSGSYPAEEVYTLQHYMNNKYISFDFQDVAAAAYSLAMVVFMLFLLLYIVQRGERDEI